MKRQVKAEVEFSLPLEWLWAPAATPTRLLGRRRRGRRGEVRVQAHKAKHLFAAQLKESAKWLAFATAASN